MMMAADNIPNSTGWRGLSVNGLYAKSIQTMRTPAPMRTTSNKSSGIMHHYSNAGRIADRPEAGPRLAHSCTQAAIVRKWARGLGDDRD